MQKESWPTIKGFSGSGCFAEQLLNQRSFEILSEPSAFHGLVLSPPLRGGDDAVLTLINYLCNRMGSLHAMRLAISVLLVSSHIEKERL